MSHTAARRGVEWLPSGGSSLPPWCWLPIEDALDKDNHVSILIQLEL